MPSSLTQPTLLDRLQQEMDASTLRQKLISSNLANSETPGYRAKRPGFQHHLDLAMDEGWMDPDGAHFSEKPRLLRKTSVQTSQPGALGRDQNDVDVDREMTLLAQNVLHFSLVSEIYQKKIQMIRYSIGEGRA